MKTYIFVEKNGSVTISINADSIDEAEEYLQQVLGLNLELFRYSETIEE